MLAVQVLALDLERTLISDAHSVVPRPGLAAFLTFCHDRFERVAVFTTVDEVDARAAIDSLMRRGLVPDGLAERLEFVAWCGEYKDLAFVSGALPEQIRLVDDDAGWIRPDQREQWIAIAPWDGGPDTELLRVQAVLTAQADNYRS